MANSSGGGSGVGAATLVITIGGILVYSALRGIGITDVLAGVTGDPLDPHGATKTTDDGVVGTDPNPLSDSLNTDTFPGGFSVAKGWNAPAGGAHGFKGPGAALLNHLAATAQNTYHLTITATTNGGHVSGSYHYLGRAFDAAGSAENMNAFAAFCYKRSAALTELIHNGGNGGNGYGVKNHVRVNGATVFSEVWEGHRDHVHVAV